MRVHGYWVRPGPNHRHVSQQNIEELRKFIKAETPQEGSERRDSTVMFRCLLVGLGSIVHNPHGTEFEYPERAAVEPLTPLPEENRAPGRQFRTQYHQSQERTDQEPDDGSDGEILSAPHKSLEPPAVMGIERFEWLFLLSRLE